MPNRTDIRAALKTICGAIDGISSESVLLGRRRAVPPHKLPVLCIYTESERKQLSVINSPLEFDRTLEVMFEIHAQGNTVEALEDQFDDLCEKLEAALLADESLGGLVREIVPVMDEYEFEEDSKNTGGVASCRYSIIYTG